MSSYSLARKKKNIFKIHFVFCFQGVFTLIPKLIINEKNIVCPFDN